MQYVYFTKFLKELPIPEQAQFLKMAGLDGADLTVRAGYPVNPGDVDKTLVPAMKVFKEHDLSVPLVSAPTNLTDAESTEGQRIFHACGEAGVAYIKIGYFRYTGKIDEDYSRAKKALEGFAKLAEKTGVRACYHTHSGSYVGSNCSGMRLLLEDFDPHHVGAYVDTGHQTVGGAPFRVALDLVARWLSLIAVKDMVWEKTDNGWRRNVVSAGQGIANWPEITKALAERNFDGVVSLHAEYHVTELDERQALAKTELEFLKKTFTPT